MSEFQHLEALTQALLTAAARAGADQADAVALDASELQIMKNQDGDLRIFTAYTQDQLENQTAYDANSYANNRDEMLLR